jgi:hypothetical protein
MAVSKEAMYKQLTQDEISAGVEPTSLTMDDFLIEANFRMQVTGPSMSGKSSFIANLIKFRDQVFKSDFTRIVYCCPSRTYKSITYIEQLKEYCPFLEVTYGLPNVGELQAGDQTLVSVHIFLHLWETKWVAQGERRNSLNMMILLF